MAVYEIKKANSLKEALNSLDPEHALRTDAELGEFFITRPSSPLVEIRMLLQDTDRPQKFLFTGHRGTGKTTELARLAQSLRDDFFIVHYSVKSVLNLFDLTYVDVILSMGLELIARATRENLAISPAVLSHIQNFTAQITRDTEVGSKDSAEVTGELNAKVVRLQARLHSEDATRETIRKTLSGRLSDLLEQIDILSREVEKATRKRILVIVEDLDKADLETAKKLFYSHANSLQAPEVSAIYTFPIALRHDNDFIQVENSFPEVRSLPILKTRLRDGNHNTPGHEALCDILTRRVDERLFTPAALKCLAEFSSGIPREMIALARRACLDARSKEAATIDVPHVERAIGNRRRDYEVLLTADQLELLRAIRATKRIENTPAYRELLHNQSALEYVNDHVWYDVHPVVRSLLGEGDASSNPVAAA